MKRGGIWQCADCDKEFVGKEGENSVRKLFPVVAKILLLRAPQI